LGGGSGGGGCGARVGVGMVEGQRARESV